MRRILRPRDIVYIKSSKDVQNSCYGTGRFCEEAPLQLRSNELENPVCKRMVQFKGSHDIPCLTCPALYGLTAMHKLECLSSEKEMIMRLFGHCAKHLAYGGCKSCCVSVM